MAGVLSELILQVRAVPIRAYRRLSASSLCLFLRGPETEKPREQNEQRDDEYDY